MGRHIMSTHYCVIVGLIGAAPSTGAQDTLGPAMEAGTLALNMIQSGKRHSITPRR